MRQLLLTICSLCWLSSFAQNFYPPVVNYSIKDYNDEKERNPENYSVVQDHRGVMYFGSSHGVMEFDGEQWNFIRVGLDSFIFALGVDSSGVIYTGAIGDFGYLKPDSTGRYIYQSLLDHIPLEDQFFSTIWRIHTLNNLVYFQAEEALYIYNSVERTIEVVYPETSFHTSFIVNDYVYLREREVGLVRLENTQLITLEGTEDFKLYGIFGLHEVPFDSLLIITQELGLYKWSNGGIRHLPEVNETPLSTLNIIGSIQLRDGNFALNTLTQGVIIINESGKILKRINRDIGIRSDVVLGLCQDRDLNLWLALENGISKINYHSPLSYFDEKTGIEGNVEAVIRFKGKIFVGTSYGLYTEKNENSRAKRFANVSIGKSKTWSLTIIESQLYVGTSEGVYRSSDGVQFTQVTRRPANILLYHPRKNQYLVAGAQGIFVYDQFFREVWSYDSNFPTFLGGEIDPFDDRVIWFGNSKSGAVQLIESENGYEIDFFHDDSGLLDGVGKPIIFRDSLIFGTKEGLVRIESEEKRKAGLSEQELLDPKFYRITFESYKLQDSLFDGQLFLLTEAEDRIWYCNEYKIGYYDFELKTFKNRPFWGIDFGRINTFYLEPDGVLWIGAADGLIRYEQNDLKLYQSHFYSLIRKVTISKGEVIFNGVFVQEDGGFAMEQNEQTILSLPYAQNDIEFLFSAPYFEDEHQPEYRYILEGADEEWSEWKKRSDVAYNNLIEGDYTFKVEARNIYGQISEQTFYSFTILPPWYRTTWAYFLYGIIFILALFIGVRISSKRLKAKNAWLEGVVEERTKEISDKNIVLEHQQKEIQDSIHYAQRIQEAILPLETEMKKWIPNSFVLFRPKDVVSGDFYWFIERDNKLILICADCTGHGVPGAFMSMIGSDRLNNIVSENKIVSPASILSELNRAIKKSLKQDGQKNATRDGMDAAVCTIDLNKKKLSFAGANRSLWIVQPDGSDLEEIRATKVAIAGFTPDDQVYEERTIELVDGLKFYMTTDGYADQFGGEKDKKYMVKNMKKFVLKNSMLPFEIQKNKLEEELLIWKGDREQVDDVCVVGFSL